VKRHLILVGLPGSGKTTVGRRAVEMLSADSRDFTDIDEVVETETGCSISRIFAEAGEAEFRRLERAAMDRALAGSPHLIAVGAGWIAQPGNLDAAIASGASVMYLRVSPSVAAGRVGADQSRPLLAGGDPKARLETLLQERESCYRKADYEVAAEGTVEEVAAKVAELANRAGG
jgi:shikimate kinase